MFKSKITYTFFIILTLTAVLFPQKNEIQNKLRLAKSFEQKGLLEEAEKIYYELHFFQPRNYQLYNYLNQILIKEKKYDNSLKLIQNQIKINKNNISLYGDLGTTYFLIGDEKKAQEVWDNALDIAPDKPFNYRIIANYLIQNRFIEKAIEVLNKGNSVSKKDPSIFSYDLANLYSLTMKFEEATVEYCKILERKPKQLTTIKNKILGYINSNKATEQTLTTIENIYNDDENIIYLKLLVDLYLRTDNAKKALDATEIIEKKTSNNGSVIFNFAQKTARLKNHKIAAEAYKIIIDEYPNSALFSEAEIGYTRELEKELSKRVKLKDEWKPLTLSITSNSSEYKNLIKAYKVLNKKYSNNKIGWEAEFRIAKIYSEKLYEYEKADSVFQKIIDEFKTPIYINEAKFGIAKIAILKNDLQKAEKLFNEILQNRTAKQNLKIETKYYLAKVNMWKGKFTEASKLFSEVSSNPKDVHTNDALQTLLILNTFKNDSTNLILFVNTDYLVEKKNFIQASEKLKEIAENKNLFILKDFAALRYVELLLALNNYKEAVIFLEQVSNCDEDNIYKDRFLYLLGASFYYGLNQNEKALAILTKFFDEFPHSIYFGKARKIISEIKLGAGNSI